MKKIFIMYFSILWLFGTFGTSNAFFTNYLKKGITNFDNMNYEEAVSSLSKHIDDNPRDSEAHYWLYKSYLKLDKHDNAFDELKKSIAFEEDEIKIEKLTTKLIVYANLNPSNVETAFEDIVERNKKAIPFISDEIFSLAKEKAEAGNLDLAQALFEYAKKINPKLANQDTDFYIQLGSKSSSRLAIIFFEMALKINDGDAKRKNMIGEKILQLAVLEWPNKTFIPLKREAALILGEERIKEVFKDPFQDPYFTKHFTEKDADKDGWVEVLCWGKVDARKNDNLNIHIDKEYISQEGLVSYYKGKEFKPSIVPITDGYHGHPIVDIPDNNSYFYLRVQVGKKVSGYVTLTRLNDKPIYKPRNIEQGNNTK